MTVDKVAHLTLLLYSNLMGGTVEISEADQRTSNITRILAMVILPATAN
jgi:hypothetical protein